jgi:putative transposase
LALVEGSTENTTLVRGLLVGLRERGLDVTKPIPAVLDGAKALTAAVNEVFDSPVIARCQLHKLRNVREHLPEDARTGREADASRLPGRLRARRRGAAGGAG